MSELILAIDIGGTSIKMGVVNKNKIVESIQMRNIWKNSQDKFVDDIKINIQYFINKYAITKIGVGCPGEINNDIVVCASNLQWNNFALKEKIQKEFPSILIKIENDGNAALLAEVKYGKLQNVDYALFVVFGRGVGGGIILNGKQMKGSSYRGSKIGHVVMKGPRGRKCSCGRMGCFETYASVTGLFQTVREINYHNGNLEHLKKLNGFLIHELYKNDDPIIKTAVAQWNNDIAEGLLNLAEVVDPSHIILAGGITESGLIQLPYITQKFVEYGYENVNIEISAFKGKAGLIGAAALHLSD